MLNTLTMVPLEWIEKKGLREQFNFEEIQKTKRHPQESSFFPLPRGPKSIVILPKMGGGWNRWCWGGMDSPPSKGWRQMHYLHRSKCKRRDFQLPLPWVLSRWIPPPRRLLTTSSSPSSSVSISGFNNLEDMFFFRCLRKKGGAAKGGFAYKFYFIFVFSSFYAEKYFGNNFIQKMNKRRCNNFHEGFVQKIKYWIVPAFFKYLFIVWSLPPLRTPLQRTAVSRLLNPQRRHSLWRFIECHRRLFS